MKHFHVNITQSEDVEDAQDALNMLLKAAKTMIALSERHGMAQPSETTLMIPFELPDGISVLISRDATDVRH